MSLPPDAWRPGLREQPRAPRPPAITWRTAAPVLVIDPPRTRAVVADQTARFGPERMAEQMAEQMPPLPRIAASEDVGRFGEAAGVPAGRWFRGGPDAAEATAAFREIQLNPHDRLPSHHSLRFAPVAEPSLGTGVAAPVVAAPGRPVSRR